MPRDCVNLAGQEHREWHNMSKPRDFWHIDTATTTTTRVSRGRSAARRTSAPSCSPAPSSWALNATAPSGPATPWPIGPIWPPWSPCSSASAWAAFPSPAPTSRASSKTPPRFSVSTASHLGAGGSLVPARRLDALLPRPRAHRHQAPRALDLLAPHARPAAPGRPRPLLLAALPLHHRLAGPFSRRPHAPPARLVLRPRNARNRRGKRLLSGRFAPRRARRAGKHAIRQVGELPAVNGSVYVPRGDWLSVFDGSLIRGGGMPRGRREM